MLSRKVPDIQDTDKLSETVVTGLYIEAEVGKNGHKTLISKLLQYVLKSKSGLRVKLRDVRTGRKKQKHIRQTGEKLITFTYQQSKT